MNYYNERGQWAKESQMQPSFQLPFQGYQTGYQSGPPSGGSVVALQAQQSVQEVRFYKSSLLFFGSAPGRLQRDCQTMAAGGWKLRQVAYIGLDYLLRRVIIAVYEK